MVLLNEIYLLIYLIDWWNVNLSFGSTINDYKLNMLSLQSPHNQNKPDMLQQAISPTFRNKRIPSAHDSYSYSSNQNLKICKVDSPCKQSEKLKRRKSQYINSSSSYLDKNDVAPQKKKSSKSINPLSSHTNQPQPINNPILNLNSNMASTPSNKEVNK